VALEFSIISLVMTVRFQPISSFPVTLFLSSFYLQLQEIASPQHVSWVDLHLKNPERAPSGNRGVALTHSLRQAVNLLSSAHQHSNGRFAMQNYSAFWSRDSAVTGIQRFMVLA